MMGKERVCNYAKIYILTKRLCVCVKNDREVIVDVSGIDELWEREKKTQKRVALEQIIVMMS